MDTTVAWVYSTVGDTGQKPALCFRGEKHMLCIVAGFPVRVLKRPVKEFDKARRVTQDNKDYPVEKAIKSLSEIAGRNGATEQARRLLNLDPSTATIEFEEYDDEETVADPNHVEVESAAELESENEGRKRLAREGGPSVLAKVCEELKLDPAVARRTLRKKGLSRPYDDESKIRAALS